MTRAMLDRLSPGQGGMVAAVGGEGVILQRLLEMGIAEGEPIEVLTRAPLGDPIEIRVRGFELSLRKKEAALIAVADVSAVRSTG